MGVSVLLRLFISSNEVCNTAYAFSRIHEQNSIFKYTTMGPMIPKEIKYNLHSGELQEKAVYKCLVGLNMVLLVFFFFFFFFFFLFVLYVCSGFRSPLSPLLCFIPVFFFFFFFYYMCFTVSDVSQMR